MRVASSSSWRLRLGALAAVVAGPTLGLAVPLGEPPLPIAVTVQERVRYLDPGTTLAALLADLGLRPRPGRLLDVEGRVLEHRAFPGAVYLNGLRLPGSTVLVEGDRVLVVDGRDRAEETRRTVARLPGRRPANPQFTLRTWPVERVVVAGALSGKVVSVRYRPLGPGRWPPAVALTFDDGPWPGSTARILAILRRFHVRATFFMIGSHVARFPEIARQVVRAGMVVGNHSWTHPEHPSVAHLPPSRVRGELARTSRALAALGARVRLFRPPAGAYDARVVGVAEDLGMRTVLWSVDPHDWSSGATAAAIVRAVLGAVGPGAIVVLHDGGGDRSATVAALPAIIRGIRAMGLRLVPVR